MALPKMQLMLLGNLPGQKLILPGSCLVQIFLPTHDGEVLKELDLRKKKQDNIYEFIRNSNKAGSGY